jgi:hypothetical protein
VCIDKGGQLADKPVGTRAKRRNKEKIAAAKAKVGVTSVSDAEACAKPAGDAHGEQPKGVVVNSEAKPGNADGEQPKGVVFNSEAKPGNADGEQPKGVVVLSEAKPGNQAGANKPGDGKEEIANSEAKPAGDEQAGVENANPEAKRAGALDQPAATN